MKEIDESGVADRGAGIPADIESLGLRERKKLIRLQRITEAAHKLFVQKGFSSTTIQDIAEEADVGLGTLYLYAKSKEDLLMLVFKQYIVQMIEESFSRVPRDAPLLDQMLAFFDGHIEYHKRDKALSRTVLKELSFSTTEQRKQDIDEVMEVTYSRLSQIVTDAQRNGKTDKVMFPGTTSWSSFALYYHLLQGFLGGFLTEQEFRKNLRNALSMLLS